MMGGVGLCTKVRNVFSSILDFGRSVRVRLNRMTDPDYDAVQDMVAERDNILGHKFDKDAQKTPPSRDATLDYANRLVETLMERNDTDAGRDTQTGGESESQQIQDIEDIPEEVPETVPDVVPKVINTEPIVIEDEVRDLMGETEESLYRDEREFEDDRDNEMVANVISIQNHDALLEQTSIDDHSCDSEGDPLKFPEMPPVQKQTTLDNVAYSPKEAEPEPEVPWYTDEDLIRIGVRAATEDCIETIIPFMEQFDEPENINEPVVDEEDLLLTDMAVKAMTEDAVETVVARIAEAARVADAIASVPVESDVKVDEVPVETVTETGSVEDVIVEPVVPADKVHVETVTTEPDVQSETVYIDTVPDVSEVEPVSPLTEPVVNNKVSVSFKFGSCAKGRSSATVRFGFGVQSQ